MLALLNDPLSYQFFFEKYYVSVVATYLITKGVRFLPKKYGQ
jgi:hypothetical protein